MPKRGAKELTEREIAEARAAYEQQGAPLAILADRLGCHRTTLRRIKERDNWIVPVDVPVAHGGTRAEIHKRAQSNVIDLASRRAVAKAEASGAIEHIGHVIAEELVATQEAAKLASEYMINVLERAKNGLIEPATEQTEADVAKAVMSAYKTFQSTVRENHGLRAGTPSIPKDDDADRVTEVRFTIVRPTGTDGSEFSRSPLP
jgi:hypothetical protein